MSLYSGFDPANVQWDSYVLDKIKVRVAIPFTSHVIESLKLETWREFAIDTVVVALEAEVLAEKLAQQTQLIEATKSARFRFPRSPWQHFKQRYMEGTRLAGWFVRRWPVKYDVYEKFVHFKETVTIEQFAMFPASPIKTPEHMRGPQIVRYEKTL